MTPQEINETHPEGRIVFRTTDLFCYFFQTARKIKSFLIGDGQKTDYRAAVCFVFIDFKEMGGREGGKE